MKKVIVLFALMFLFTSIAAAENSYTITPSMSELTIKLDETAIIEIEVAGDIPTGSSATVRMDNAVCDLSWGENRKSEEGVVLSLQVSGILLGETHLSVLLKGYEDVIATITVDVVNEPGAINFMGIPWDITPEQFDQALTDKGLEYTKSRTTGGDTYFRFDGMPFAIPTPDDLGIRSQGYKYESSNNTKYRSATLIKVAGYNCEYIMAEFKPSYSVSTRKLGEPYRLSRAAYQIWGSEIPKEMTIYEAYDDLTAKLTKLYGEPSGSEKGGYYCFRKTWWHAEDGTGVSLRLYESIGVYHIEIEYGVANEEDYLSKISSIRQWEKQQVVDGLTDNVDGL